MPICCGGKSFWQQGISRQEYLLAAAKSVSVVAATAYLFYSEWLAVILLFPLGVLYFKRNEEQLEKKKRQEFERQFQDALQSLGAQMNIGYSMENAIKEVQKDLQVMYKNDTVIVREFSYMVSQLNLNVNVELVWEEFAKRVNIPEADSFVTIFAQAKRSGGDSIAIIKNAVRQIVEKAEVNREIATVIAEKKLEFQVMSVIPFGIIGYMRISFPEFMDILYGNIRGVLFMSGCLLAYLAAWRLGNRIVEIEV